MKKAMIILNPSAGREKGEEKRERLIETLRQIGYKVAVFVTEKENDAVEFAEKACREMYDAVISVGGDGTLNETINGLAEQEHRPVLGVIPLGTVNDFARALNIPLDSEEAIRLLENQVIRMVDVGKVNNRCFSNVIAIGNIAEATSSVSIQQKTLLGPLAYLLEGAKALIHKKSFKVYLQHDNGKWDGEALLVLVTLTKSGAGFKKMAPDAKVDDGLMRVVVVRDIPFTKFLSLLIALLKGEHVEDPAVEYFHTSTLHIASDDSLITNVDGEKGPELPLTLHVLQQHLKVFV